MDYELLFQQIRDGALGAIDQALLATAPPDKVWQAREESIEKTLYFDGGVIDQRADASKLGPREVEHVASTERACGVFGDVVLQNAWDFTSFFDVGGPLLWGHNREHPIGKVTEMRKGQRRGERVQVSHSRFQPEGMSPVADQVWSWVDGDWVRGSSVSFKIRDAREPSRDDHKRYEGLGPFSRIVTKAELSELSITPCPADKGATKLRSVQSSLERAAATGEIDRQLAEMLLPGWGVPELVIERFWPSTDDEREADKIVARNPNVLTPEIERRFAEVFEGLDERIAALRIVAERIEEASEARSGRAPALNHSQHVDRDEFEGLPPARDLARSLVGELG